MGDLSEKTILNYKYTLAVIENRITTESIDDIITKPEEFLKKLDNFMKKEVNTRGVPYTIHFKQKCVGAYLSILYNNPDVRDMYGEKYLDVWRGLLRDAKTDRDTNYNANIPTEKQEKAWISLEDLITIYKNIPEGSLDRLLFVMYTEMPPVRSDYYCTKLVKDESEINLDEENINFINFSNNTLYLNNYKTERMYGKINYKLPDIVINEINKSLEVLDRKYLFVKNDYNLFDKHSFYVWSNETLKKYTNEYFHLTMFRHIYISCAIINGERIVDLDTNERENIASIMGHDMIMQDRYSWRKWLKEPRKSNINPVPENKYKSDIFNFNEFIKEDDLYLNGDTDLDKSVSEKIEKKVCIKEDIFKFDKYIKEDNKSITDDIDEIPFIFNKPKQNKKEDTYKNV